jgi:chemotaxis protein histidine kinase CheA
VIVDMRSSDQAEIANRHAQREDTVPVVLVEGFGGERQAIPLRSVSRLETLPRTDLERAFGRTVVQYDGGILPIVDLGELIGGSYDNGMVDQIPTVVCHEGSQQFGLIVSRIVDIIDLPQTTLDAANGTSDHLPAPLVADGRVTELLEVGRANRMARPDLFTNEHEAWDVDGSCGSDTSAHDSYASPGGLPS